MTRVVFTCGDINGIGPEIVLKAISKILTKRNHNPLLFVCPINVFEHYYKSTGATFKYQLLDRQVLSNSLLNLIPLPNSNISPGKPTNSSGKIAFQSIKKSLEIIKSARADVLVTAPISKFAFNLAKIKFPGHTELLAKTEKKNSYMMLFLSESVNAGLLTIHIPITKVSNYLFKANIIKSIELINTTAKQDLGLVNPKIAVLGLNPHAGENGLIGKEEEKVLIPAIKSLQRKINVTGPFVPDAFWGNKIYKKYDVILGMYHDQILIPFKLLTFNSGVNFTAGLKLIRTSPDHGTAYDIAGMNIANESSILQSYKYAIKIFQNRKNFIAENKSI